MAAIAMQPPMRSPTPPSSFDDESPMSLATAAATPLPVPNKHLATPIYTVKPVKPDSAPVTPPASPPTTTSIPLITPTSVLYPPEAFKLLHAEPPVYSIDAPTVAAAIKQVSCQPLPSAERVFPWLHGLHPDNQVQLTFFFARKRSSQRTPSCFRELTIVKVGKELETSKLRGAVLVGDVLSANSPLNPEFLCLDPRDGFGVRNFQIQTSKLATVSDIIVYGDHRVNHERVVGVAKRIAAAQIKLRNAQKVYGYSDFPVYNTFVIKDSFSTFEKLFPDVVAFDSRGRHLGTVPDLPILERHEMSVMSRASEIHHNVFLGCSLDRDVDSEMMFDLFIEAADQAQFPSPVTLRHVTQQLKIPGNQQEIDFPASGSFAASPWAKAECGAIVDACKWIYETAQGPPLKDQDGDSDMDSENSGKKILIHCLDGYTETSLLGLAYVMYAEGLTVDEAWIRLHKDKGRNFFAYPTDLELLLHLQTKILQCSPAKPKPRDLTSLPRWVQQMDGSLPSRVLPHMYLGNLCHANNPAMLKLLGITRILSVGEERKWCIDDEKKWGASNFLYLDNLQDNGVDQLTPRLEQCLEFIDEGKKLGQATLVHCRVGVSRSATICIAEVMRRLNLSVPRAYCFVRARRLNVIIQPHLKFMYELLKWEETQKGKERVGIKRDLEWATIAREIALMNRPYSR